MPEISKICQWCWRKFIVVIALLVILLALIFSIIRLSLPMLNDWKSEVETAASAKLGYQVNIENINASWKQFYPRVHLINTSINNESDRLFFMGELIFSVDIVRSLLNLDLKLHKVTVIDTRFDLLRTKNNKWYLNKQLLNKDTQQEKEIYIPKQLRGIILTALNSQFHFKDEVEGKEHFFDDLSASATNSGKRYQLFISSDLPSPLGNHFDVGVDVKGDLNHLQEMQGQAYISVNEIDVKKVLPWVKNIQPIERGILSGKFWFDIGDKKQNFFAQLNAEKLKINTNKIKDKAFANIKTEFERIEVIGLFKKENNTYQAYLPSVKFVDNDNQEAVFSDDLLLSISAANGALSDIEEFRVSYDEVSLETMQKIISLMPESTFKEQLRKTKLLGFIKDGFIECQNIGNRIGCAGKSYFEKIDYSADASQPSLLGFSGKVIYRDNYIYAQHDSKDLVVGLPDFFVEPIKLTSLKASTWLDINSGEVVVRKGQALAQKAEIDFAMDVSIRKIDKVIDKKNSGIRLLAKGKNIAAKNVSNYLPLKKMHPQLKIWLENAFKDGVVKHGSAVVDSTFESSKNNKNHVWQIQASGEKVDLQFDSKWPLIENISGDFLINDKGLFLHAKKAEMLNMPISHSYVWLDNFWKSVLHVDLSGKGELSSLLDLVQKSPLSKGYEGVLKNIGVSGQQEIHANLEIPFASIKSLSVDVEVELKKAKLHEKIVDLHISNIPTGKKLYISEAAFVSDSFTALFNGQPADFSIDTSLDPNSDLVYTNIKTSSRLPTKEFWPEHSVTAPYWLKDINGMSNYIMNLRLPINAKSVHRIKKLPAKKRYPVVNIASDLLDTEIGFPAPLNKISSQKSDLNIDMLLLPDNKVNVDFSIGNYTKGKINTAISAGSVDVEAAHILLGKTKKLTTNNKQGIYIEGDLQRVNLDKWLSYIDSQPSAEKKVNNKNSVLNWLSSAEVDIASLYYLDRDLVDIKTDVSKSPEGWLIGVENKAMKGKITLPEKNILEQGISVAFEYFNFNDIPASRVKSDKPLNPKEVTYLQAQVGRLQIKDYIFNNVELLTSRTLHGIKIDNLTVNNPGLNVVMQGSWLSLPNGESETNISGDMLTENLGEGLQSVGYAELIESGKGNIEFTFHWPNSPADFALDKLVGEAKGAFEKGQVLALDPGGTGRIFSLISLNRLPKRLLFDFKDVDSEGYYFRKMSGDFAFSNGIAETENFKMRSSIGKIYIEGQTDVVKQTYNQKLRFLPDLSATLPVVGTLLGGGVAGAGILIIDGVARLFGKQLDDIGEKKYSVTGTWENPIVEPLWKKKAQDADTNSEKNDPPTVKP